MGVALRNEDAKRAAAAMREVAKTNRAELAELDASMEGVGPVVKTALGKRVIELTAETTALELASTYIDEKLAPKPKEPTAG